MWRSLGAHICALIAASAVVLPFTAATARAQTSSLDGLVAAVVHVKTFIDPEGRTTQNLGREREGSGIVIDSSGLVLTIGYLMVEAHAAEIITNAGRTVPATIVGYDHNTGFGLLRSIEPLKLKPLSFGKSAEIKERDPVLIASFGGSGVVAAVHVASKRQFAGSWEYMVDGAIFTAPPHPAWSGAALVSREGKLVGVGSLIVGDASGVRENNPGNMFVPTDALLPILGRALSPLRARRPWSRIPRCSLRRARAHGRSCRASSPRSLREP